MDGSDDYLGCCDARLSYCVALIRSTVMPLCIGKCNAARVYCDAFMPR